MVKIISNTNSSNLVMIVAFLTVIFMAGGISNIFSTPKISAQISDNSNTTSSSNNDQTLSTTTTTNPSNDVQNTTTNGLTQNTNQQQQQPLQNASAINNSSIISSIPLDNTMTELITSKVNVSLSNATIIAEKSLDASSHAVLAKLGIQNGFLVYTIWVADSNNNFHKIIVDPGNGKILSDIVKQPGKKIMNGLGAPLKLNQGKGQGPHGKGFHKKGQGPSLDLQP